MQDNKDTLLHKKQNETTPDYLSALRQENQRLLLENQQLKKNLEREEFLHKNLYRQWTELNAHAVIRKRELKHSKLKSTFRNNFYRYSFYIVLLITIVTAFYLFNKADRTAAATKPITTIDTSVLITRQVQEQQ